MFKFYKEPITRKYDKLIYKSLLLGENYVDLINEISEQHNIINSKEEKIEIKKIQENYSNIRIFIEKYWQMSIEQKTITSKIMNEIMQYKKQIKEIIDIKQYGLKE